MSRTNKLPRGSCGVDRAMKPMTAVLDPKTNELVAEVPVGIRPGPVAVGEGAVWVANLDLPRLWVYA